jgi:hypothetical protein
LAQALYDAGFAGVDENTELQLEFTGPVPEQNQDKTPG